MPYMSNKIRFNLFGGGFQHAKSSTLWKESRNIIWDFNSLINERTFYVDEFIEYGLQDKKSKFKYGLILESNVLIPQVRNMCILKHKQLKEQYEYIFTHDKVLLQIDPELFKFCPANGTWINNPRFYSKTKLVSMVCSNKQNTVLQRYRVNYANKFKESLDLYGRGFKEIASKEEALSEYMFSICIENDAYESYYTEKILDCFACGTIPVYLGTPDIGNYFNHDGIVILDDKFNLNDLTPELYHAKILAITENLEKVQEYFTVEDWMYQKYFIY